MPAGSIQGSYAEKAWKRAKAAVSKQYGGKVAKGSDRYYKLVMHVTKSICASPKHDCTPTIKTHPSKRRAESMKNTLNRIEESGPSQAEADEVAARLAEQEELAERMGFSHDQSDLYHEVLSTVGYGDVKNPDSAIKAATKKIYDNRMATLRNNLDLVGKAAVDALRERSKERKARG